MTIKRRLFISNILMTVLPLILTAVMSIATYYVAAGITGVDPIPLRPGGFSIVEESRASRILRGNGYRRIEREVDLYRSDSGSYVMVVPDGMTRLSGLEDPPTHIPVLMFFSLLLLVLLTNYALTRYLSRRIITSIDTLVSGVREISDGNLDYRIHYSRADEFDAVCNDFNEMASRLSDMVRQRQMDEDNRKELIAGISHDLRTPLTSVKAYIEGLRNGVATTPEMREKYLDTIQSKTEDIEYIIRQLFLFSKMDLGEFPFNFELADLGRELAHIAAGLAEEYAEKGVRLNVNENAEGLFVSIDTVQFRTVIQNILGNSVKYAGKDDIRIDLSCQEANRHAVITIKDNGPGVPAEMLGKLFDVFFRGDMARNEPSKGSGLGLAISSKIVERLNGTIVAENNPEGGLCVKIALPLVKEV